MGDYSPPDATEYKRIGFTPKQREAALAKTNGQCAREGCNKPAEDVDHILPVALGGPHELDNWEPLCKVHHKIKTAEDIKAIRKADRAAGRKGQYNRRKAKGSALKGRKTAWPKRSFPKKQKKLGT